MNRARVARPVRLPLASPRRGYDPRIGRAASPLRQRAIPYASVMVASLSPLLPVIASAPVLPPLGFLLFLAWRCIRPGLWPVWAGVPLGLFDDLFSGQPLGSGAAIWTAVLLAFDLVDQRLLWRGFWQDWAIAALFIAGVLLAMLLMASLVAAPVAVHILGPQLIVSVAFYPLVTRLAARLDRWRLND